MMGNTSDVWRGSLHSPTAEMAEHVSEGSAFLPTMKSFFGNFDAKRCFKGDGRAMTVLSHHRELSGAGTEIETQGVAWRLLEIGMALFQSSCYAWLQSTRSAGSLLWKNIFLDAYCNTVATLSSSSGVCSCGVALLPCLPLSTSRALPLSAAS